MSQTPLTDVTAGYDIMAYHRIDPTLERMIREIHAEMFKTNETMIEASKDNENWVYMSNPTNLPLVLLAQEMRKAPGWTYLRYWRERKAGNPIPILTATFPA